MQLLVSLYTNRLLNLIDGSGRHEVSQDDERWIELTDLHHQYERDSALDEIYMIRTQFIWTLVGSHPQLLKEEGKSGFNKSFHMNEINLKAQSLEYPPLLSQKWFRWLHFFGPSRFIHKYIAPQYNSFFFFQNYN